jgi:hypothetical protein
MTPTISKPNTDTTPRPSRKRWEAPAIVLERSLLVSAQDGPPQPFGAPNGLLGPLGASGDSGNCGGIPQ